MFFLFYKCFKFVAHGCKCGAKDGMVVLVIVWMTLIDNHHAIESKARNRDYLVENDKCDSIMGLEKLKMMKKTLC
jgi:hypothetical protein